MQRSPCCWCRSQIAICSFRLSACMCVCVCLLVLQTTFFLSLLFVICGEINNIFSKRQNLNCSFAIIILLWRERFSFIIWRKMCHITFYNLWPVQEVKRLPTWNIYHEIVWILDFAIELQFLLRETCQRDKTIESHWKFVWFKREREREIAGGISMTGDFLIDSSFICRLDCQGLCRSYWFCGYRSIGKLSGLSIVTDKNQQISPATFARNQLMRPNGDKTGKRRDKQKNPSLWVLRNKTLNWLFTDEDV